MKVNIQLMKSNLMKKERNPGIKRAIDAALLELNTGNSSGTMTLFVYIDGDPISQKVIFLN
jgi:hypothetical protein